MNKPTFLRYIATQLRPTNLTPPLILLVRVDDALVDTMLQLQRLVDAARASSPEPPPLMRPGFADLLEVALPLNWQCISLHTNCADFPATPMLLSPLEEDFQRLNERRISHVVNPYGAVENLTIHVNSESVHLTFQLREVMLTTGDLRHHIEQATLQFQEEAAREAQEIAEVSAQQTLAGLKPTAVETLALVEVARQLHALLAALATIADTPGLGAPPKIKAAAHAAKLSLNPALRLLEPAPILPQLPADESDL